MDNRVGVIFDMDGVLVDSYQAHFESWRMIAAEEGLTITEKQFAATFGRTSREIIAAWWGEELTEAEIRKLDDRKEAAYRQILANDFPAMPGVRALIERLHNAGMALAIGSSGPPENIEVILDHLQAQSLFQAVVSGADVTRGKPDPQVFLKAAQRLGIPPDRCVVVEDAPLGVDAAHGAGAAAIGFASTGRTREGLAKAELVVDSLEEITPEVVRRLVGAKEVK
ncbi:MAG: beta-phosphoglucomutase family hydrolase [Thermoguttaceae bacterium]|jgi:beta-phosphoglucomutase